VGADPASADVTEESGMLAPFAEDPAGSVVIVDFDGTLAPIVPDPPGAAPLYGADAALARLARHVGTVAVVSGRPVAFLRRALPVDGLVLYGHYGVERFDGSAMSTSPEAQAWVDAIRSAGDEAEAALPRLFVERKGALSVALHWRRNPHLESQATDLGRRLAGQWGLRLEPGRQALELRPPLDIDKGTAATELAAGATAALVIGDDRGDVAAFTALDRLVDGGDLRHAVRIAVRSSESPLELLARAHLHVDGPKGVLGFLTDLATRVESRRRPG
jgi:trehalose 6-phosphate phosphatase